MSPWKAADDVVDMDVLALFRLVSETAESVPEDARVEVIGGMASVLLSVGIPPDSLGIPEPVWIDGEFPLTLSKLVLEAVMVSPGSDAAEAV